MRRNILASFGILFFLCINAQTQPKCLVGRQQIMELLQKYNVPALGIGVIEQGTLVEVNVYGETKEGNPAPYNTIFDIASLTKSIVAMTTLQLVENGDWNLDESLSNYWIDPDIKDIPLHKKITTRLALSHQCGFSNWRWMNDSKKLEFLSEPGTKFQYSGEGFEYLRKALENKFEMSLQQLSDSLLFAPLKMKDTRHSWGTNVDETRFAVGHDSLKKPYEIPRKNFPNGADNVLTTIEDFGIFGVDVLEKLSNKNSIYQEMILPQTKVRDNITVGLSWFLFKGLTNGEYALYNAGGDPGTHTVMILLPKSQRGIIIFTNGDKGYLLYKELIPKLLDAGLEITNRI